MTRDVEDVVIGGEVVDVEVAAMELLAAKLAVVAKGPFTLAAVANHAVTVRKPFAAASAKVAGNLPACVGTLRNPAGTTKAFRVNGNGGWRLRGKCRTRGASSTQEVG